MEIINFLQIDERLATSGQPTPEDLDRIARNEYQTVINLALPLSDNAIANEGQMVTSKGMNYIYIPVVWEAPQIGQFRLFADVMNCQKEQKVWVHCVLNLRVSCFIYLYNVIERGFSASEAREIMDKIWRPNTIWSEFISKVERGDA